MYIQIKEKLKFYVFLLLLYHYFLLIID